MPRIKKPATPAPTVPQTKTETADAIAQLGQTQRQFEAARAEMNAEIAAITTRYQPQLAALEERAQTLQTGIQTWCEAHREELCGGEGKTAQFVTGTVSWRQRPPSVRITGTDAVIAALEKLGLTRFLRIKKEVSKSAILSDPAAVQDIKGVVIATGVEDFVIEPLEV